MPKALTEAEILAKCREVIEFYNSNGHLPRQHKSDEYGLATFLNALRKRIDDRFNIRYPGIKEKVIQLSPALSSALIR